MKHLQLTEDTNQADAFVDEFEWDNFTHEVPHSQFPNETSYDPMYPNIPNTPGIPYGPQAQNPNHDEETNPFRLDFTSVPTTPEGSQAARDANTVPVPDNTLTAPQTPANKVTNSNHHVTRSTTGHSRPRELPSGFVNSVRKKISKDNKKRGSSS